MKEFLKYHYPLVLLYWISFLSAFVFPYYGVHPLLRTLPYLFLGLSGMEIRNVKPGPDIPWWKGTLYFVVLPVMVGAIGLIVF